MKRLGYVSIMALIMPIGLFAQEAEENTFTDEELTSYATVMKWAKSEQKSLSSLVKDSVKIWLDGSELTASLYNEMSKSKKKGTLAEVEANEAQVAKFEEISSKIDTKKAAFTDTYKTKIKEDIGAGLYNRLKKALKADAALKERYEAVLQGLPDESDDEEAENASESN